jgi:thiaminase (transcriptional activator TenA)
MTGFCDEAWERTGTLRRAMLEHPFNVELAAGTLSRERFQFYLVQDARYLIGFARALAVAAARADGVDDVAFFSGAARESIVVERELHAGYFVRYGLSESDADRAETSPTCLAYTSYLLATAKTGSYEELIAALLPCFWIYHHVGTRILRDQEAGARNPFQAWIDTYADDEFAAAVLSCRDAVDRAAAAAAEHIRARMLAAFTRACEYEWMFWDSAYWMERWPTAALR